MKAWLLLGASLLVAGLAQAQVNSGVRMDFRFGRIVLASGDTLDGPVSVRFSTDILYLAQADGRVRVLIPAAVAAFAVQAQMPRNSQASPRTMPAYDPSVVRLFRTLAWAPARSNTRPEPSFFEQLSEGPILLLRRQSYVPHMLALNVTGPSPAGGLNRGLPVPAGRQAAPQPTPPQYRTVVELHDVFFLAWPTGEIQQLKGGKKEFLGTFPDQMHQIEAYAKAQGLGYTTAEELHALVSYANSLSIAKAPEPANQAQ